MVELNCPRHVKVCSVALELSHFLLKSYTADVPWSLLKSFFSLTKMSFTGLKGVDFRADYISRLWRFFFFPRNIIRAKYHRISHARNLIYTKYQEKYLKMKMNGKKLATTTLGIYHVFFSLNNKTKQ